MIALRLKEKKIGAFFNSESESLAEKHTDKGIPSTAQDHIDIVCDSNAKSVIDVGSGPGSLLIEMLKRGVEVGIGVDLAGDMNQIATRRLKEAKIVQDRYEIIEGSFLELNKDNFPEIMDQYDAVSLHLVLCCHPDREGMLNQTTKFKPKTIVLTVPRTWILMRAIVGIYGLISKIRRHFQPYVHSQRSIDRQLLNAGYKLTNRKKTLMLVMSSYTLKE
ncbi:MAG: class I SAM-dependent methyltransferase [Candidatus Heimdallarchaeota archaeon]|nr:class I SAM-dependent methyltransferase [Candidatus Heimdallarchaeota archaeon]